MSTSNTPRFFWIGEESEVFVADSWEQILADDGNSGTGIEKVVDGVAYDDLGEPIEYGELPANRPVKFRVMDEDERLTGEIFEGTLAQMAERWPANSLPEMLMTQYA
jgi:hypothetical protein